MKTSLRSLFVLTAFLCVSLLQPTGCRQGHDHDDDHAEAEGLVLRAADTTIVRVQQAQVNGRLTVPVGTDSDTIAVWFLDGQGNEFRPLDPSFALGWFVLDTLVADIYQMPNERWSFHVRGKAVDTTSVELRLLHSGHIDFRTPLVPIEVIP